MKPIIEPISRELLESELTQDKFIRTTNYGENKIYIITHHDSPNLMREIGRLRELSFRAAGGGTGKDCDLDHYDSAPKPYQQLVVWDPEAREIMGGYRFMLCKDVPIIDGKAQIATAGLMNLSAKFISEYLPLSIELGRSFVQPNYQSSKAGRKALFALDNLWDGLGAILTDNPEYSYFFGKVTMYTSYNAQARDILLHFFKVYFPDHDELMRPYESLVTTTPESELQGLFSGKNYKEDYKVLSTKVRERGENVPPLINSYMNLSPTMRTFGTAVNKVFGGVEETGIMITMDDIYPTKKERHITTYTRGV